MIIRFAAIFLHIHQDPFQGISRRVRMRAWKRWRGWGGQGDMGKGTGRRGCMKHDRGGEESRWRGPWRRNEIRWTKWRSTEAVSPFPFQKLSILPEFPLLPSQSCSSNHSLHPSSAGSVLPIYGLCSVIVDLNPPLCGWMAKWMVSGEIFKERERARGVWSRW